MLEDTPERFTCQPRLGLRSRSPILVSMLTQITNKVIEWFI